MSQQVWVPYIIFFNLMLVARDFELCGKLFISGGSAFFEVGDTDRINLMQKRVLIIQRRLTHYRVAFFQLLRKALSERGIELQLLVGVGSPLEGEKEDSGEISWAIQIPTKYFFKNTLCWQPVHQYLKGVDLVIVTQENALIANHLMVLQPRRKFTLAFWGHGANFQSKHPNGFKERYKRWTSNRVEWWFAYTQKSLGLVVKTGFPAKHVTVVNNSIDTSEFQRHLESVNVSETQSLRSSLGFGNGPVAIYIGSLYAEKRLEFLFGAAERIRMEVENFALLIIGGGPELSLVQKFCNRHHWVRWVGSLRGREKALYFTLGHIMLNPGLVGLSILDSFVSKLPMLTTDCKIHSPEIAYLKDGYNGLITDNDVIVYANTAIELLKSPESLSSLRRGCEASSGLFTLDKMVKKFSEGISNALTCE